MEDFVTYEELSEEAEEGDSEEETWEKNQDDEYIEESTDEEEDVNILKQFFAIICPLTFLLFLN